MKTLILLSAIPGSGKSTWAKAYQSTHENTFIIASDDVRARVAGKVNNFDKEPLVWETFLAELRKYAKIEDVTVIADATNLQNKYRRYYLENTPGYDKHVLVLFNIPFEVCLEQNRTRHQDRIVPDEAMLSLQREFEEPTQEIIDLYDEYLVVDRSFQTTKVK